MATHPISRGQDDIQVEIHISAPAERVFQALTDPRQLLQWWGQKGIYHPTDWKADLRVGGQWRCEGMSEIGKGPYYVSGKYLDLDPPRLLVYTWVGSWSGPLERIVRWELQPQAEGTLVRLRHSGFAGAPEARDHYQGWLRVTAWMKAFVEKGETMEMRSRQ